MADVQAQYKRKVGELLTATPAQTPRLIQEIQRLRLVVLLLKEVEAGQANEATYRELVLMTRMMGKPTGAAQEPEENSTQDDAEEELEALGIEPRRAADLLKIFERIAPAGGGVEASIPNDYEPTDPDAKP